MGFGVGAMASGQERADVPVLVDSSQNAYGHQRISLIITTEIAKIFAYEPISWFDEWITKTGELASSAMTLVEVIERGGMKWPSSENVGWVTLLLWIWPLSEDDSV
jgi:hypothetical protein